jgi:hypothetical protein
VVDAIVILVIVVVIIVVAIGAALSLRRKKSYCPQCAYEWREGSMTCLRCKYSPFLPPAHVAIDTSSSDFSPSTVTTSTFQGDHRDPWVRRNF